MSGSPIHIPNAQETLEAPGSLRRFTPAQRSELAEQVLVDHLKDTHTELESRFEAAMTLRQRDKSIETMDRLIGLMEAGIAYHYTGDPALPDGLRSRSDFKAAYTFYDKQSAVFAAMALQGACVEQYSRLYELATEWATINNSLASSEKNELGLLVLAGNESLNIQAVVSFVAEACSNNERLENTRNAALRALVGVNSD
ncbi:MAG: hypothetical protein KDD62_04835, partial [Bdellovibrionales bacterium]|nr:hypothetical protein [Bdellovibrionales bacterium]